MPCVTADWSKLGDFEVTTPVADLLQEISDKGIPASKDEVSQVCCAKTDNPTVCLLYEAQISSGGIY